MRYEPGGLKQDCRRDGMVHTQRDCKGAFAGKKLCENAIQRIPRQQSVFVCVLFPPAYLTTKHVPGRGKTSTEAIHVAATMAAYN